MQAASQNEITEYTKMGRGVNNCNIPEGSIPMRLDCSQLFYNEVTVEASVI